MRLVKRNPGQKNTLKRERQWPLLFGSIGNRIVLACPIPIARHLAHSHITPHPVTCPFGSFKITKRSFSVDCTMLFGKHMWACRTFHFPYCQPPSSPSSPFCLPPTPPPPPPSPLTFFFLFALSCLTLPCVHDFSGLFFLASTPFLCPSANEKEGVKAPFV